jgi:tetraacyldisaccharide 4'-kinase
MAKTPLFWQHKTGISLLLLPLSWLYTLLATLHRKLTRPSKMPVPVIAIGNIVAGGAGKTPVTIALIKLLIQAALHPHILSRGYGAKMQDVMRVDLQHHRANQVGDEPLLLARYAPTWVYPNRAKSAKAAISAGAKLLMMDDGLQHHRLHKDIQIMVVNAAYGFGNQRHIPAGPMRESLQHAMQHVNAVVLIGDDTQNIRAQIPDHIPVFSAHITPDALPPALQQKPVIAFAGIAHPDRFFDTLRSLNMQLVATHAFTDHHPFTPREMEALKAEAKAKNAVLITTEKDFVRLPQSMHEHCYALPITLDFVKPDAVLSWLTNMLKLEKTP